MIHSSLSLVYINFITNFVTSSLVQVHTLYVMHTVYQDMHPPPLHLDNDKCNDRSHFSSSQGWSQAQSDKAGYQATWVSRFYVHKSHWQHITKAKTFLSSSWVGNTVTSGVPTLLPSLPFCFGWAFNSLSIADQFLYDTRHVLLYACKWCNANFQWWFWPLVVVNEVLIECLWMGITMSVQVRMVQYLLVMLGDVMFWSHSVLHGMDCMR